MKIKKITIRKIYGKTSIIKDRFKSVFEFQKTKSFRRTEFRNTSRI